METFPYPIIFLMIQGCVIRKLILFKIRLVQGKGFRIMVKGRILDDQEIESYQFVDNVPTRGPAWKGELPTMHAWMPIEGELNLKARRWSIYWEIECWCRCFAPG